MALHSALLMCEKELPNEHGDSLVSHPVKWKKVGESGAHSVKPEQNIEWEQTLVAIHSEFVPIYRKQSDQISQGKARRNESHIHSPPPSLPHQIMTQHDMLFSIDIASSRNQF